jgi:CubicO group peptidase (beta-lactamase class C family)
MASLIVEKTALIFKIPTTSFHLEIVPETAGKSGTKTEPMKISETIRHPENKERKNVDISLFGLGGLMQTVTHVCIGRLIEDEVGLDENVKQIMKNAWTKNFFDLWNDLRELRGRRKLSSHGGITLEELLTLELPFQYFEEDEMKQLLDEYNNGPWKGWYQNQWNCIVVAFLVRDAYNDSFAKALQEIVLDHFQMNNTILSLEKFTENRDKVEKGYSLKPDGAWEVVESSNDFNEIDLVVGTGAYSCTQDMANLLQELIIRMQEDGSTWSRVFRTSKTGSVNGYTCHYLLIPTHRAFIIVFINYNTSPYESGGDPLLAISRTLLDNMGLFESATFLGGHY